MTQPKQDVWTAWLVKKTVRRAFPVPPSVMVSIAAEALLWLSPALIFIYKYVEKAAITTDATSAHIQLVLITAGTFTAVRTLLHCLVSRTWSDSIGAVLMALGLATLWAYYIVALAGFGAWGRLVSWGLITTYLARLPDLVASLGPTATAVAGAGLAVFLMLAWCIYKVITQRDWTAPHPGRPASRTVRAAAALIFIGTATVFFWRFTTFPPIESGEPISSTLNTHLLAERRQTHHSPGSRLLEQQEANVRRDYLLGSFDGGTNVVLIIVDALRARSMGVYGYNKDTTPYLSELVRKREMVAVPHAYSVCAESACGIYGILASRYIHSAVREPITLIEVLRKFGYDTHLLLSGDHTNFYDLRKVYGNVDTYFDSSRDSGGVINDDLSIISALAQLPLKRPERNFFQFHLMANHVLGKRALANPEPFGPAKSYYAATSEFALARPTSADRPLFVNHYDTGVLQADTNIRRLLETLARKGVLRDALVIITADHGELVGEKGMFGHAKSLHDAVIRIPLLVMRTGTSGNEIALRRDLASQVDLAPTVLEALRLPIPATWQGVPLQLTSPIRPIFSQQGMEVAVIKPGAAESSVLKFVTDTKANVQSVYDVGRDPDEQTNLVKDIAPAQLRTWRAALLAAEVHAREAGDRR